MRLPGQPDPSSPTEAGKTSLKDRRGLKLGVDTGAAPKASAQRVDQADENAPLFVPVLSRKSTFNTNNPTEPASPLLVRRMTSDLKGPLARMAPDPETPKSAGAGQQGLKVDAFKMDALAD